MGEHSLWWKQTFYGDSVRLPAILSRTVVLPYGVHCDGVSSQLDLSATMLDAIGAPPLPQFRGRSLFKLLHDVDGADGEDVALSGYCIDSTSENLGTGLACQACHILRTPPRASTSG